LFQSWLEQEMVGKLLPLKAKMRRKGRPRERGKGTGVQTGNIEKGLKKMKTYNEYKAKDRLRKQKAKAEGKILTINQMSAKAQMLKRRKHKEYMRMWRAKKAEQEATITGRQAAVNTLEQTPENTGHQSSSNTDERAPPANEGIKICF